MGEHAMVLLNQFASRALEQDLIALNATLSAYDKGQ